jgi:acyl carrier protein
MIEQTEHTMTVREQIRQVVAEHARLELPIETLDDQSDLFSAGMTSHASVNLMLALEETFDIEFPEASLKKSTFASVASIEAAISELR